jgi:hypothetical protein
VAEKSDEPADASYVLHNGARIERSYFEENVAEARGYRWEVAELSDSVDHAHCIVCLKAIGPRDGAYYRFEGVTLCAYCYNTVIE